MIFDSSTFCSRCATWCHKDPISHLNTPEHTCPGRHQGSLMFNTWTAVLHLSLTSLDSGCMSMTIPEHAFERAVTLSTLPFGFHKVKSHLFRYSLANSKFVSSHERFPRGGIFSLSFLWHYFEKSKVGPFCWVNFVGQCCWVNFAESILLTSFVGHLCWPRLLTIFVGHSCCTF